MASLLYWESAKGSFASRGWCSFCYIKRVMASLLHWESAKASLVSRVCRSFCYIERVYCLPDAIMIPLEKNQKPTCMIMLFHDPVSPALGLFNRNCILQRLHAELRGCMLDWGMHTWSTRYNTPSVCANHYFIRAQRWRQPLNLIESIQIYWRWTPII